MVSNWKTRDFIILQELSFSSNTNLNLNEFISAMKTSVQSLKNLGIFGEVAITPTTITGRRPELYDGNYPVDIKVKAVDKWTLFPIPYALYNNKSGGIFGFLVNEGNFFGMNMILNLGAEYQTGPDQYKFTMSYTYPKAFGSHLLFYLKLTYLDFWDSIYNGYITNYYSRATSLTTEFKTMETLFLDPWPFAVGLKMNLDFVTNNVQINLTNKSPNQRMNFYISAGLEQGLVNYDGGLRWGDDNNFWVGVSPLDAALFIKFQNVKHFRVFDWDVFSYRLGGWITPTVEQLLDNSSFRGIVQGMIRGNYIFFGNFEFRKYAFTVDWPTVMEFYFPVFLDVANASSTGTGFSITNTMVTAGFGMRLYPKYLGGKSAVLRIDLGVNLTQAFRGMSFADYFYIGFDFSNIF